MDGTAAKTDGQVAYETFYGPFGPPAPWDEAYGDARDQWEATAGAVAAPLRARIAGLERERDAARKVIGEYEKLAQALIVPNAGHRIDIRREAGLDA